MNKTATKTATKIASTINASRDSVPGYEFKDMATKSLPVDDIKTALKGMGWVSRFGGSWGMIRESYALSIETQGI